MLFSKPVFEDVYLTHPQPEDAKEQKMESVKYVNGLAMPANFDDRKIVGVREDAPKWVKDNIKEIMTQKKFSLKMAVQELKRSPFFDERFLIL